MRTETRSTLEIRAEQLRGRRSALMYALMVNKEIDWERTAQAVMALTSMIMGVERVISRNFK